jgi:hypothetical protein
LTEPLMKPRRSVGAGVFAAEITDHRHLRLLRARCQRPCRRAAESGDEFAPSKAKVICPSRRPWGLYRGNIARPKAAVPGPGACPGPGAAGKGAVLARGAQNATSDCHRGKSPVR